MKIHRLILPLALLLLLALALAGASGTASLKILSPADGAQLDAGEPYPLQYGRGASHLFWGHLFLGEPIMKIDCS